MMPLYLVTITSKGQFTIPKAIRERLGLRPGSRVTIDVEGEWIVIRSPRRTLVQQTAGNLRRFIKKEVGSR